MTVILNKKLEFISSLIPKKEESNALFRDFINNFYRHASLGYLLRTEEHLSKDLMFTIAKRSFELFQKQPLTDDFCVTHHTFTEKNVQVLFLNFFHKPFSVRSIDAWLRAQKLEVSEFLHATFSPKRTDKLNSCFGGNLEESVVAIILPISIKLPEDYKLTLHNIYQQVTIVVGDCALMQKEIKSTIKNLQNHHKDRSQQAADLLKWLENDHFTFLGMRYFEVNSSGINTAASQRLGVFKLDEFNNNEEFFSQISKLEEKPSTPHEYLVQIKKTSKRSAVYRRSRIDCIEILKINEEEKINGILQIIGLFTSDFYKTSPINVPGLKSKAEKIYQSLEIEKHSYAGKQLKSIINCIPLDEFYYLNDADLLELSTRILNMHDGITVFARYNSIANSVSVLIYLPKHRYSENLKKEFGEILFTEFGGEASSSHAQVDDTLFARLVYVVNCEKVCNTQINMENLEEKLWIASQTWGERFKYFCKKKNISENVKFSDLYINLNEPKTAANDASIIFNWLKTEKDVHFEIISKENKIIVRILQRAHQVTLGQIIPIFNNFHLKIQSEITFFAEVDSEKIWIHCYEITDLNESILSEQLVNKLIEGLNAAWAKVIEVDPYNALTIACNLGFNEIIIFRALGRFLKQLGFNYSQKALAECLASYPEITKCLAEYFKEKFNPQSKIKTKEFLDDLQEQITNLLSIIKRLDHDRIMRRFLNIMIAMVRTNAYQSGEFKPFPCVSFKVNSTQIIDVPKPSPLFEIFVYSPTVEGCHLRGGTIARGGIRWSDRPEDFRSETLGLMKAQMVKNSVIVPVGSKGGFFVKNYESLLEAGVNPAQLKDVVIKAYQSFIGQLVSLTDNFVDKAIISPKNVLRYDQDDPYLVVAADKGTATFSDIANKISQDAGFWLGDAFASGGSNGYDHKKLAITARGAWIAVRRHFWELGIDCQNTEVSVVGVGDMAGDVFGNGMLQSTKICLVAAFNHKHIFLDPTPDPEQSYQERKRLFDLPGSNWSDYNQSLISKGGGIFERSAKLIEISPEVAKALEITESNLSPDELISKILISKVDLLFFGGIGTFIKSPHENNAQVSDRANDTVRVNADAVRAKIIGEGANLGMTQRGRIEYSLRGGKVNMDAIDNSAGVDCSDHEVNLKIMCQVLLERELLSTADRDITLKGLADEVCDLVLEDNWSQTLILTLMQEESSKDLNSYINLIKNLEKRENLPLRREIEYIPGDEELIQRKSQNLGITRPELAILLAYSKIHLYQDLLHALKNTACFGETYYQQYFPKLFQEKYKNYLSYHPLKVEITATVLSNLVINIMGPCFVGQLSEAFRVDPLEVVHAFVEVLEHTDMRELFQAHAHLQSDVSTALPTLRKIARNLSQCVMVRLSNTSKLLTHKTIASKIVPFSVMFALHTLDKTPINVRLVEDNYDRLGLRDLWNWSEHIHPIASWQTSTWLLMQHDLIKTVSLLCQQTWGEEKFTTYNALYEQLKGNISGLTDQSQDLLLLDYAIRQLKTII